MTPRIIAVDWSGAAGAGARRKIWLAEARNGELVELRNGRDRRELVEHLIEERSRTPHMVVGLDFGFAFPVWYTRELRCAAAPELWARMANGEGDEWLRRCEPPFWGRTGKPRPYAAGDACAYRVTELGGTGAQRPKSVFQVNGGGAVGTGSIRGMAALHGLREGGFSVWPFDDAGAATVIEIYPRVFTPGVKKSVEAERRRFIERYNLPRGFRELAASNDDAFDAAVSAIEMSRHADELASLPVVDDPMIRLEGMIWRPTGASIATLPSVKSV